METLDKALLNKRYKIKAVSAPPKLKERLKNLGLFEGAQITAVKFSRGKKNMLIYCGGALLAVRQSLAAQILLASV